MIKKAKRVISMALMIIFIASIVAMPSSAEFYETDRGDYLYLNVWGSSVTNGSAIRLYYYTGHDTQNFLLTSSGGAYFLKCQANKSYAINRDSGNGNAIMWPISSGAYDSYLEYIINSYGYIFNLKNYSNGYLTSKSREMGAYVYFGNFVGNMHGYNQFWRRV